MKIEEALDMAIEALEREPSTDAVSRQAILDCKYAISDDEIGERKYVVDVTDIVELPPVTPTRPKGHWIDDTSLGYHVSICSNCDWRGHGDTCLIYKPKYCPNCGADMRGDMLWKKK